MLDQLRQRVALGNYYPITRILINPSLDNRPDLPEDPRAIDDEIPRQLLRVVVIAHLGCFLDEIVNHLIHRAQGKALEVQDHLHVRYLVAADERAGHELLLEQQLIRLIQVHPQIVL